MKNNAYILVLLLAVVFYVTVIIDFINPLGYDLIKLIYGSVVNLIFVVIGGYNFLQCIKNKKDEK